MIVDNKDIEPQSDLTSFAGRIAVIGGLGYGGYKTFKDFQKDKPAFNVPASRKMEERIASVIKSGAAAESKLKKNERVFLKTDLFNYMSGEMDHRWNFGSSIDDLVQRLQKQSGFDGRSADLHKYIKDIYNATGGDAGIAFRTVKVKDKAGNIREEISHIKLNNGRGFNYTINPVLSNGAVMQGDDLNVYSAKSVYRRTNINDIVYEGIDVASARAVLENMGSIKNGTMKIGDITDAYDSAKVYNDKFVGVLDESLEGSGRVNPENHQITRESAIQDPHSDTVRMSREQAYNFRKEQAKKGMMPTSAEDVKDGTLILPNSPINSRANLGETANPKQLFKNVQYVGENGSSWNLNAQTLFLDDEELGMLVDNLNKAGYSIGDIAEEQLIASDKAGKIISKQRGLSVSRGHMSDSSNWLMNQITGAIVGEGKLATEDDIKRISGILSKEGLAGFDQATQDRVRKINLDDYESHLKRQLLLSEKRKEQLDFEAEKILKDKTLTTDQVYAHASSAQKEIDIETKKIADFKQKLSDRNFFGARASGEEVNLSSSHRGLYIDDVLYTSQSGEVNLKLRREKEISRGDKVYDSSGEIKATVEERVKDLQEHLLTAFKQKHQGATEQQIAAYKESIKHIKFVANKGALKKELTSRNAYSVLESIGAAAELKGDSHISNMVNSYKQNYKNIAPDDRTKIYKELESAITGNPISDTMNGKPLLDYTRIETGFGAIKTNMVAFGEAALDMGYGKEGSMSKRQLMYFEANSMPEFVKDIHSRADNIHYKKAAIDLNILKGLEEDPKYATIDANKISINDIYSKGKTNDIENNADILEQRRKALAQYGGSRIVEMDQAYGGVKKIPILAEDHYTGMIGKRVGSKTMGKRNYAEYDRAVADLLTEYQKPNRNPEIMEILAKKFLKARESLTDLVEEGVQKAAVHGTMYAEAASAPKGFREYINAVNQQMNVKNPLQTMAVLHDEDFIQLHGQETYDDFMKQVNDFGSLTDANSYKNASKKIPISNAYGMATRFPDEGLNAVAMNVLPASALNANVTRGSINMISMNRDTDDVVTMKTMYGDFDGDALMYQAARSDGAIKEVSELVFSNSDKALAYREITESKAKLTTLLKGREQNGFLSSSHAERSEIGFIQKDLEKNQIGTISNSLEEIHRVNREMMMQDDTLGGYRKGLNLAASLQAIAENAIKAKKQTMEELRSGKTTKLLEAFTDEGVPIEERKGRVHAFYEDLALSAIQDEKARREVGARLRSGDESIELINHMKTLGVADAEDVVSSGLFKTIASNATVDAMFEYNKMATEIPVPIAGAIDIASGKEAKQAAEGITSVSKKVERMMLKGAKNIGLALLPAAGIGLAGTLMSGGSVQSTATKEYSDGQAKHQTNFVKAPIISERPARPRYERANVRGMSRGSDLNYGAMGGEKSNVTITDHSRNFDKYKIQEEIEKGY